MSNALTDDLIARAAIADLVHGYAQAIRHRQFAQAAALFMPDGSFELCEGEPGTAEPAIRTRCDTPDELLAYLLAGADRREQPVPMIHNLIVAVTGATATAASLMEAQLFPSATRTLGEYDDTFRREDGIWRFASRRFTIFGSPVREHRQMQP